MRRQRVNPRQYPRTARLNEVMREVLGDELERLDDERLEMVTITEVAVEPDLRHATVWFDSLHGGAGDAVVLEGFADVRVRLQGALARQLRTKRTPTLTFRPDEVIRSAERVEKLLREHPPSQEDDAGPA